MTKQDQCRKPGQEIFLNGVKKFALGWIDISFATFESCEAILGVKDFVLSMIALSIERLISCSSFLIADEEIVDKMYVWGLFAEISIIFGRFKFETFV